MGKIDDIYRFLGSKKITLYLFIGLAIVLVPNTILTEPNFYFDVAMRGVIGLLAMNLSFCTIQRFKSLRRETLLIHIGIIVTLAGGLISGLGYVATINIHEGSATDTVFRWDIEQDIDLGFAVKIKKIRRQFYPIPVQVGVLNQGKKAGLFTVKTGESFVWQEFKILVNSIDLDGKSLELKVFDRDERLLGEYDTAGASSLPSGFPLAFKLVAYRDPVLKKVGAELVISEDQEIIAEGYSEVNDPYFWNGLKFHVTNYAVDRNGLPYAGLQIVRDPGVRFVYLGFILICLGCLLHLQKSFRRKSAKAQSK